MQNSMITRKNVIVMIAKFKDRRPLRPLGHVILFFVTIQLHECGIPDSPTRYLRVYIYRGLI